MVNAKVRVLSTPAIQALTELMDDPETPPPTRASIDTCLIDRILGKPTAHVESDVKVDLQQMLATWVAHPGDDLASDVIDAEWTDDNEDDDLDAIPSETHGATHDEWTREN